MTNTASDGQIIPESAENIRVGAPYHDPAFELLAREYDVWGKADSALCAVFWRAGKTQSVSGQRVDTNNGGRRLALDLVIEAIESAPLQRYKWPVNWPAILIGLKDLRAELERTEPAAAMLDILRRYAEGRIDHLANGQCPDSVKGYDTRDPDCPVCIALGITSTLPSALRADGGDKQW